MVSNSPSSLATGTTLILAADWMDCYRSGREKYPIYIPPAALIADKIPVNTHFWGSLELNCTTIVSR
eukprot:1535761-Pleurochrysis_carterae.AAC.1